MRLKFQDLKVIVFGNSIINVVDDEDDDDDETTTIILVVLRGYSSFILKSDPWLCLGESTKYSTGDRSRADQMQGKCLYSCTASLYSNDIITFLNFFIYKLLKVAVITYRIIAI